MEKKARKKIKLRPHYSEKLSEKFWERVNSLKEPERTELYACGVLLQNMEGTILSWLEQALIWRKKNRSQYN